jgi:diaminohydroxyphosphoribosylaminopyrimidine deaminase/5-amino-6-(5-phosphoribosylamino)uracil reductase
LLIALPAQLRFGHATPFSLGAPRLFLFGRQARILPALLPGARGTSVDEQWAARAIELARLADHRTSPNPMVGAVVLDRAGRLAGEGYHHLQGRPHAEQEALTAAGEAARGGTLYVNLEPCTHAHRTPSCADAIIDSGVTRVVASMLDPDSRVRGAGIARLRAAGIATSVGMLEEAAQRLNEFYVKHRSTGRPFVTAKYAMSLDGKIATRTGESRWITGEASRRHAHRLRHEHDAILVGVNTVLRDDPELSTRLGVPDPRQPLRIVLDSRLRTPPSARVLGARTMIATTREGKVAGAEVLSLPAGDDQRVNLGALLDELGRRRILSVLVEGGGATHASFLEAGLVDKVYAYIAPTVIGGGAAPGPVGGQGVARLSDALRLHHTELEQLDEDYLVSGYVDVHRDS